MIEPNAHHLDLSEPLLACSGSVSNPSLRRTSAGSGSGSRHSGRNNSLSYRERNSQKMSNKYGNGSAIYAVSEIGSGIVSWSPSFMSTPIYVYPDSTMFTLFRISHSYLALLTNHSYLPTHIWPYLSITHSPCRLDDDEGSDDGHSEIPTSEAHLTTSSHHNSVLSSHRHSVTNV